MPTKTINIAAIGTPETTGGNMCKNVSQLIMQTKRSFIALLAIFFCVTACASDAQPPKPPLFVPFEAQKAGSTFVTELRVVEHRQYIFSLELGALKGENMEDAKRISALAGSDERNTNGKPLSYGIPIPVKLVINVIDTSGERIIYDKEIYEMEKIGASRRGFIKLINSIELKRGLYRISIQSLKDIPELIKSPITFGIYGWPNSNPID